MKQLLTLTLLTLLGLGWVLNEMKPEPKSTEHWHEDKAEIFY